MNEHIFIEQLLKRYFRANECAIKKQGKKLTVRLTDELDKILMNRPFYWHYMKTTGQKGVPKTLTITLKPTTESTDSTWVHFGSPLIRKIEAHMGERGRLTRQFQQVTVAEKTLLEPWLLINFKISYKGKQLKEEMHSLGINLINGLCLIGMMELLNGLSMANTIPNYCYTISPLITIPSAYRRLEQLLLDHITTIDHPWALEAQQLLAEEINMIEFFYRDARETTKKTEEIQAVNKRLQPTITINVINGGLFFLQERFGRK